MLTEEQLKAQSQRLYEVFQQLETDAMKTICERVGSIGEASATDAHRLRELASIGRDVEAMERQIADTVGKSETEVRNMLTQVAEVEYNGNEGMYRATGTKWVPFAENAKAQALLSTAISTVNANVESAAGLSASISGTIGFINTAGKWEPMAKYYQDTVDYAIMQVRTGQTDFHSAMRKTVKNLADNGMCYYEADTGRKAVDYESGYVRRLDSSVRNAFMGGQQRMSREMAELQGRAFGADGMEVSWHSGARPTHVPMGGQQYTMRQFEHEAKPLLEDFNCYHRAFPIVLGISKPAYTREELAELNARDAEKRTFEGKEYNKYEALQMQRRFETAMRREKDRAICLKASGDKEAEKIAKAKVTALNQRYKEFSRSVGLTAQPIRASVSKYTRGQSLKTLTLAEEGAIKAYMSSEAYVLNAKLRTGEALSSREANIVKNLDNALEKLPAYEGTVNRSLLPSLNPDEVEGLIAELLTQEKIRSPGYTSAAKDIYDEGDLARMIIHSKTGRDISKYNPSEQEVLFKRDTVFKVKRRWYDGGKPFFELEEE